MIKGLHKKVWMLAGISAALAVPNTLSAQTTGESTQLDTIEEVLVVGYGSSTKKEFTGANSSLKGQSLEKLNIPRMDQALQGQIAGVTISTNSGSPGGA